MPLREDLSFLMYDWLDIEALKIAPGTRVRVQFADSREGRITDFTFVCID